mgnify:FL=1
MVFKTLGTRLGNLIGKSFKSTIQDFKSDGFTSLFKSSDTVALQNFNKELKKGTDYHLAYNNTMKNASSTVQKNALSYIKCQKNLKRYNNQLEAGKLTQDEYNARVDATKAKMAALGVEAETLTIKQRALTVVTKLASAAFVALKAIAVTAIISGIIAGISALVNSYQEAIDKAKEASEAVKSQAEEALDYIIYHTNFAYSFSSP